MKTAVSEDWFLIFLEIGGWHEGSGYGTNIAVKYELDIDEHHISYSQFEQSVYDSVFNQ